jgi:lipopolysaccharide biosynthesis regulator YciM
MKIWTFIVMLLGLALVYLLFAFVQTNKLILKQDLALWGDFSMPVGQALVFFLVVGALFTLFFGLSREMGTMIERWRLRKASKKSEEIEEEYSRGLIAELEGREEEALGHFRAVLEHDSRHFNTLLKFGQVLRGQEKYSEAIEFHRKAHHLKEDDTRPLYNLVEDFKAKGDIDQARVILGKIIAINKHSVAAWKTLRSLHMTAMNWEKALEAHERVCKLMSANDSHDLSDSRFGLGIRYEIAASQLAAGKTRESIGTLKRLLKDDNQFIPAHIKLGEALTCNGQDAEAVQIWNTGFETTGSPIFLTMLEDHFLTREQPLAAIEALKQCIKQARNETLPRFSLGKLYFRLEMMDDAIAILSSIERNASNEPTLHYLLGRIHERHNDFRSATQEYRLVIKEMDLIQLEYTCSACSETAMTWTATCVSCGEWNTIELKFREESSLDEQGLSHAPVYSSRR